MGVRDRVGRLPHGIRIAVPLAVIVLLIAAVLLTSGDDDTVAAADDSTTTTEATTSTTEGTTTTSETTTTTAPPTATTMAPTTTTTATTLPPPTVAPPTTAPTGPATPTEFRATVRGVDQGPDYYATFSGTTFGGDGGFHVIAKCRPGTVKVTVLEDGWAVTPPSGGGPPRPTNVWAWADDVEIFHADVTDGTVISGAVSANVAIRVSGPSEHDVRIRYDCRG